MGSVHGVAACLISQPLGRSSDTREGKENKVVRNRIQQIESYVRQSMSTVTAPDLRIAHDFKHVDRVRGWALCIASSEAIQDLELVEATALLHDIGLTRVEVEQRSQHAQVGAEIAAQFLREHQLFSEEEIGIITDAIRCHSSPCDGGALGEILRDADKLDALGAVGIMRAFTSKYTLSRNTPPKMSKVTHGRRQWEGLRNDLLKGKGLVIISSTK